MYSIVKSGLISYTYGKPIVNCVYACFNTILMSYWSMRRSGPYPMICRVGFPLRIGKYILTSSVGVRAPKVVDVTYSFITILKPAVYPYKTTARSFVANITLSGLSFRTTDILRILSLNCYKLASAPFIPIKCILRRYKIS